MGELECQGADYEGHRCIRKEGCIFFGGGSFLRRLHFISCPRPQLWELICFRLEVTRTWRCSNLNALEVARRSSEPGLLLPEL